MEQGKRGDADAASWEEREEGEREFAFNKGI